MVTHHKCDKGVDVAGQNARGDANATLRTNNPGNTMHRKRRRKTMNKYK
jgi:hypothetical protein